MKEKEERCGQKENGGRNEPDEKERE